MSRPYWDSYNIDDPFDLGDFLDDLEDDLEDAGIDVELDCD